MPKAKKLSSKIKQFASEIPSEIKQFALRGVLLLIGWCLLYGLILKPYDLIDPALTKYTSMATVWLMQLLYHAHHSEVIYSTHAALINIDYRRVLFLGDACNGLDIYVLFIGFILCVPMGLKKTMPYIFFGITGIFLLNVLRCVALIALYYNKSSFTDFTHHYVFQITVYAAIFVIWERYFRSLKVKNETAAV